MLNEDNLLAHHEYPVTLEGWKQWDSSFTILIIMESLHINFIDGKILSSTILGLHQHRLIGNNNIISIRVYY